MLIEALAADEIDEDEFTGLSVQQMMKQYYSELPAASKDLLLD